MPQHAARRRRLAPRSKEGPRHLEEDEVARVVEAEAGKCAAAAERRVSRAVGQAVALARDGLHCAPVERVERAVREGEYVELRRRRLAGAARRGATKTQRQECAVRVGTPPGKTQRTARWGSGTTARVASAVWAAQTGRYDGAPQARLGRRRTTRVAPTMPQRPPTTPTRRSIGLGGGQRDAALGASHLVHDLEPEHGRVVTETFDERAQRVADVVLLCDGGPTITRTITLATSPVSTTSSTPSRAPFVAHETRGVPRLVSPAPHCPALR